jgi:hypothetical protein
MGVPTSEVGYTSATTRRETTKSMTDVAALKEEEDILELMIPMFWTFQDCSAVMLNSPEFQPK